MVESDIYIYVHIYMYIGDDLLICDMTYPCVHQRFWMCERDVVSLDEDWGWDLYMYTYMYVYVCDDLFICDRHDLSMRAPTILNVREGCSVVGWGLSVIWLVCVCVTYSCVHHVFWMGKIWREQMCDMLVSYVWHNSCVTWCVDMCDMTHLYVWHELLICVTWLIDVRDVTHWLCDMPQWCVCNVTYSHVQSDFFFDVRNDSFDMCNMTHLHM